MSRLCTMVLAIVFSAGCTAGLYSSTVGLDTHETQRAISYDGQVEYVLERTPTTIVKAIEYRSRGSDSPQVALVLLFVCNVDEERAEDCYPLTDGAGNQITYGASGSGLLNDALAGIGSATVGAAGFYGGMRALRPATHTEQTSISGVSGADAQTGYVDVETGLYTVNTNLSKNSMKIVNKPVTKNRAVIQQPPMMPQAGND